MLVADRCEMQFSVTLYGRTAVRPYKRIPESSDSASPSRQRLFDLFLARKRQHHFLTKSASLPRMFLRASLPGMFLPASLLQGSSPALRPGTVFAGIATWAVPAQPCVLCFIASLLLFRDPRPGFSFFSEDDGRWMALNEFSFPSQIREA